MAVSDVVGRARSRFERLRHRWRWLDLLVRSYQHYTAVDGNQYSGGVTYFGFLSFFPLLAVAFGVVGLVVRFVPRAPTLVDRAIENVFPGLVGTGAGQINADAIASQAPSVGTVGFLVLVYTALGIASSTRDGLQCVFDVPRTARRSLVVGKVRDLATIAVVAVVLVVSVGATTGLGTWTTTLVGVLGGDQNSTALSVVVKTVGFAVGVAASTLMLYLLYSWLPEHRMTRRHVLTGAFVAALGLEALKLLAALVITRVTTNPLYGTFAVIVALLVWINYFARLMLLGASIAVTANRLTENERLAAETFGLRASTLAARPAGVIATVARARSGALLGAVLAARVLGGRRDGGGSDA